MWFINIKTNQWPLDKGDAFTGYSFVKGVLSKLLFLIS